MGRGKLSQEVERQRAIEKAQAIFGITIEVPPETTSDHMREAQAVLNYFEARGQGFKEKPCKQCGRVFAYSWDSTAIAMCSIRCAKLALQAIGLDWNPEKEPGERWGRTIPAVVSPEALRLLKDSLDLQEDLAPETLI